MTDQPASTPSPTGAELVQAAQMGSTVALNRLIDRYFRIVYAIAYARLRERESAEDLVQEIFLSVYLNLGKLKNPNLFGPWVSRIARNAAINWLDKGLRRSKMVAMVPLDENAEQWQAQNQANATRQNMEETDRSEALQAAIFRLPIDQREIVLMRHIEGISVEEISQRTGIHTRTIWRQLNKSMTQLKTSIESTLAESLLSDAAPAIRAPRSTAARTLAILASATALSATTKSALAAASATAAIAEQSLASLSAAAPASLFVKTLASIKSIAAIAAAGGQIMGTGKIIAIGVVSVAVLVGGKPIYEKVTKSQQAAPSEKIVFAESSATREPGRVYIDKSRGGRYSVSAPSMMQSSSRQTIIKGSDAKSLIAQVYSFPSNRCQIPAVLPEGKYDVTLDLLPGQANSRNAILQQGFEEYFRLTSRKEIQEMDVLLLTSPTGPGPAMRPSSKGPSAGMSIQAGTGKLSGTNVNMLNLTANLEGSIHKPVFDESGLRGTYDITLQFDQGNPQSIIAAARNQLGVVLTPARRKVEVLIIENRKR